MSTTVLIPRVPEPGADLGRERIPWVPRFEVIKYADQEAYEAGRVEAVESYDGNLLTDAGANLLLSLITGTGTALSNANARIYVGDSTTAAAAAQTALLGVNQQYRPMDSGYPAVVGRTATFQGTFDGTQGNFEWREWGLHNGLVLANRKVAGPGAKFSNSVWVARVTITF